MFEEASCRRRPRGFRKKNLRPRYHSYSMPNGGPMTPNAMNSPSQVNPLISDSAGANAAAAATLGLMTPVSSASFQRHYDAMGGLSSPDFGTVASALTSSAGNNGLLPPSSSQTNGNPSYFSYATGTASNGTNANNNNILGTAYNGHMGPYTHAYPTCPLTPPNPSIDYLYATNERDAAYQIGNPNSLRSVSSETVYLASSPSTASYSMGSPPRGGDGGQTHLDQFSWISGGYHPSNMGTSSPSSMNTTHMTDAQYVTAFATISDPDFQIPASEYFILFFNKGWRGGVKLLRVRLKWLKPLLQKGCDPSFTKFPKLEIDRLKLLLKARVSEKGLSSLNLLLILSQGGRRTSNTVAFPYKFGLVEQQDA